MTDPLPHQTVFIIFQACDRSFSKNYAEGTAVLAMRKKKQNRENRIHYSDHQTAAKRLH